ncbi:hypothetical protein R1flu_018568 [Riccia fluitans]|uniref:Methyltransferase FkbM domain-containing protein n=1 Tax=Riccia fluitans TaxID=41844 RepID=A0ABD1ZGI4_9MARC
MVLPRRNGEKLCSPFRSINVSIILIWTMVIYIVLDISLHLLSINHEQIRSEVKKDSLESKPDMKALASGEFEESESSESDDAVPSEKSCNTIEDYIDVKEGQAREAEDPWNQLKWCLPPAACRVNGHLIERAKRRVFTDLGANSFHTSIAWFATRYPVDFTEVYGFETARNLLTLPPGWDENSNWIDPGIHGWRKIRSRAGMVPSWFVRRVKTINKAAGVKDTGFSVNVTRFIKEELKLQPEDAVIVKIDIEGAEWPILYEWLKDPAMPKIVDELFVELHYFHPDNNWGSVKQWSREDATKMLAELRFKGFYAHYWD